MSKEEYKKMWNNMIEKLNETERHYLAIVNNQKNQEIDRLINLNKQLVEECQRLDDEETRLINIINELEKWLIEQDKYLHLNYVFEDYQLTYYAIVLDKLKELKENNK